MLPPHLVQFSTLELATVSKTVVTIYKTTRRYNPEDNLNLHRLENLESHIFLNIKKT
jgi:hypothetical protein